MCGPRLGLPLPPPPFLDFYGMPGGLDGNYRKVISSLSSQGSLGRDETGITGPGEPVLIQKSRNEKLVASVFHVSEKIIVEHVSTVSIELKENRFVSTENAMPSRKKSKLERYVLPELRGRSRRGRKRLGLKSADVRLNRI